MISDLQVKTAMTTKDNTTTTSLTYQDAGVDIDAGNALVEAIKPAIRRTTRPEVLGGLGGFGGLFELPSGYQQPVLVAGTDGVGTKLLLAQQLNDHSTIGIDLVAMCVNDLIVQGAEPLFFLDYYATGKLNVDQATQVINGIAIGCEQAGCSLIGGETAEMPGMYQAEDYDLAGFCVGIVEKEAIIEPGLIQPGQTLVAIGSSGFHSNGYSLVRKIIDHADLDIHSAHPQITTHSTLGQALLEPTKLYVKPVLNLLRNGVNIAGVAHITGGGLTENLPRVLPQHVSASIDLSSWQLPPLMQIFQQAGNISQDELLKTFNCGIGLIISVEQTHTDQVLAQLVDLGESAWVVGQITDEPGRKVLYR